MSEAIPVVNEIKVEKGDTAEGMLSLENLIKSHIKAIDEKKAQIRQNKEMLDDSFKNNPTYREHNEKVKEATKARGSVKLQIAKSPDVARLDQKIKDLRFDLNEQQKTLSDLLIDYKESTGATQLELFNGQTVEIVHSAKVVKMTTRYNK